MDRRDFLVAGLAASAIALEEGSAGAAPTSNPREFYLLRRYSMQNGPQTKLVESYFQEALIPALTRMGMGPIGAFKLEYGPETPAFYLLIPGSSVEALATLDLHLAADPSFMAAAGPFWNAPATTPAYVRVESKLLSAFPGWPKLTPPAGPLSGDAGKPARIFQLRTYESPSDRDHVRKVEMFQHGEFEVFESAGFHCVFFGDTLIGPRMPSLTYMVSFADMAALTAAWKKFLADPGWKKLSTDPQYAYEELVSSITNLVLSPLGCSQI